VVVGAGETGELVVQHLLKAGCTDITVVNRSHERGAKLAERFHVALGAWEDLSRHIAGACRPLLIVDVGVPRNFEPSINEIENIYLYSIDELREVADQNLKAREKDIAQGLDLVYESAADFMEWFRARDVGPLIGRMKKEFKQIGRNELERFFVGPREEASCRLVLETMVNRVVNKLLHCVIKNVDTVAKETHPATGA